MSWTFVLRPGEMELFGSCRRAWDFSARVRQNYVPLVPPQVFDFDKAMHAGLAAYYFPAMDDWNRSIVRPLAIQGFQRAMAEHRRGYEATAELTAEQEREWTRHLDLGEVVLNRYFNWAVPNDDFDSVLADEDLWVPIPDPSQPGRELGTLDERPMRSFIRIEQLISDANDEYWVVDHRIVWDEWIDDEALVADPVGPRAQWAVEVAYPQLLVAGTVYNQLLVRRDELDGPLLSAVDNESAGPDLRNMTGGARHVNTRRSPISTVAKEYEVSLPGYDPELYQVSGPRSDDIDLLWDRAGNEHVRRIFVRRSRASVTSRGAEMARHAIEVRGDVAVPPSPSEPKCSACAYRKPCRMMDHGLDIDPVMAAEYRKRSEEEFEEDGLRWSPNRRAARAPLGTETKNARFRWG